MKNVKRTLAVGMTVLMLAGVFSGCGKSDAGKSGLSGKISLAGSTSMEKLCEAMSESFMEVNPGITVTVEYTGSSAGVESLIQGSVDIGNASRNLKDGEKGNGAVENIVAIDGIAVITDKNNSVSDLTTEQLADVYTGKVTNWSEFGGSDAAIVVIGREAGSGTRGAFEELLEVEDLCKYAQELDSTGAVLAKVASTPGAIGYISLDAADDTIRCDNRQFNKRLKFRHGRRFRTTIPVRNGAWHRIVFRTEYFSGILIHKVYQTWIVSRITDPGIICIIFNYIIETGHTETCSVLPMVT